MPAEKPRAGSAEAIAVYNQALTNPGAFEPMFRSFYNFYPVVMKELGKKETKYYSQKWVTADAKLREVIPQKDSISKTDLLEMFYIKSMKGIVRAANLNYIEANTASEIKTASTNAFRKLCDDKLIEAVDALIVLGGVGPATAVCILSYKAPEKVAFASDQVLDVVNQHIPRNYTTKDCMCANQGLIPMVAALNAPSAPAGGAPFWTLEKLGMAIWAYARACDPKVGLVHALPTTTSTSTRTSTSTSNGGKRKAEAEAPVKKEEKEENEVQQPVKQAKVEVKNEVKVKVKVEEEEEQPPSKE
jgi:hypothetical protein